MESFFLFLFALDLAFNYAASTDKVPSPFLGAHPLTLT
jgi:hypothetical protein